MADFRVALRAAALLLLPVFPAWGADRFVLCPPFAPDLPALQALEPNAPAQAEGDQGRYDGNLATLQGAAQLQYQDQRLLAERINYRLSPEQVMAQGGVRYWDSTRILFAEHGEFQPKAEQGQAENVRFWLIPQRFSGESRKVLRLDAQKDQLFDVSLSSCPVPKAGETRDWTLDARQVDLNHATGRGVAHDAWLHFKGAPIMYTPYFDFPLDDRRATGFLYPSFNYNSETGISATIPYYWNIAPDRDATLTLRPMSKRGVMLGGEYRQLWQEGRGILRGDWLPNDSETDEQRYFYDIQAQQQLADWSSSLAVRRASDIDYFRDFGNSAQVSNTAYLESHLSMTRSLQSSINDQTGAWQLSLLAQEYQNLSFSVNGASLPYKRMPQLVLSGEQALGALRLNLLTEAVSFKSEYDMNPEGERYALLPTLSLPMGENWYRITPSVGLHSVNYQLDAQTAQTQNIPVSSIDARFFFDRFGERYHQQLEPRLFYLYVPYHEQDVPLFDSDLPLPSLSRLFSSNRFIGRDRQGDANALSYALTWRAMDAAEGFERLSFGLGQQYRFSEERVTLNPGDPINPRGAGEAIAELGAGLSREWSTRITASESQTYAVLSYRPLPAADDLPHQQRLLNLYYGNQAETEGLPSVNQIGLSFAWPLSRQWQVIGHAAQDLDVEKPLQLLAGLAYESCCWRVKFGAEYYAVSNPNPDVVEYSTAALLQFELKGLGSLGSQADSRFERAILGYRPDTLN
ncbi:MAG: LPS assembly protein LptD [Pseudomonadota bacterium]